MRLLLKLRMGGGGGKLDRAIWWILLSATYGYRAGDKWKKFNEPDQPKFCILGEIAVKTRAPWHQFALGPHSNSSNCILAILFDFSIDRWLTSWLTPT